MFRLLQESSHYRLVLRSVKTQRNFIQPQTLNRAAAARSHFSLPGGASECLQRNRRYSSLVCICYYRSEVRPGIIAAVARRPVKTSFYCEGVNEHSG